MKIKYFKLWTFLCFSLSITFLHTFQLSANTIADENKASTLVFPMQGGLTTTGEYKLDWDITTFFYYNDPTLYHGINSPNLPTKIKDFLTTVDFSGREQITEQLPTLKKHMLDLIRPFKKHKPYKYTLIGAFKEVWSIRIYTLFLIHLSSESIYELTFVLPQNDAHILYQALMTKVGKILSFLQGNKNHRPRFELADFSYLDGQNKQGNLYLAEDVKRLISTKLQYSAIPLAFNYMTPYITRKFGKNYRAPFYISGKTSLSDNTVAFYVMMEDRITKNIYRITSEGPLSTFSDTTNSLIGKIENRLQQLNGIPLMLYGLGGSYPFNLQGDLSLFYGPLFFRLNLNYFFTENLTSLSTQGGLRLFHHKKYSLDLAFGPTVGYYAEKELHSPYLGGTVVLPFLYNFPDFQLAIEPFYTAVWKLETPLFSKDDKIESDLQLPGLSISVKLPYFGFFDLIDQFI